jgi:hypothetical protein
MTTRFVLPGKQDKKNGGFTLATRRYGMRQANFIYPGDRLALWQLP